MRSQFRYDEYDEILIIDLILNIHITSHYNKSTIKYSYLTIKQAVCDNPESETDVQNLRLYIPATKVVNLTNPLLELQANLTTQSMGDFNIFIFFLQYTGLQINN